MTQNNNELLELEELKTAYNLMDKRLDGQEIVSDEQLRTVMERRLTSVRSAVKGYVIGINLIAAPLTALWFHFDNRLTTENIIGLSILWVASLLFGFFFLRKTGRTIYADYDMTTVCAMDAKYQKLFKWYIYASAMYWMVFTFITSLFDLILLSNFSWAHLIVWLVLFGLMIGVSIGGFKLGRFIAKSGPVDPMTGEHKSPKWIYVLGIVLLLILIGQHLLRYFTT